MAKKDKSNVANLMPGICRIVVAVIKDSSGRLVERPAIIVRTWSSEEKGVPSSSIQAQVFCDGDGGPSNDGLPNLLWKSSLEYDETGRRENSWHWPTRD